MRAFFKFITDDWWISLPMFLMSLSAIFLVIWRILLNMNANTQLNVFLPQFQEKLDKEGVEGALKFCRSRTDIIPIPLFPAGLGASKSGLAAMRPSLSTGVG